MKKAKLKYTKQGYSYITCTKQDCFNWGGMAICDNCSAEMEDGKVTVYGHLFQVTFL